MPPFVKDLQNAVEALLKKKDGQPLEKLIAEMKGKSLQDKNAFVADAKKYGEELTKNKEKLQKLQMKVLKVFEELNGHLDAAAAWESGLLLTDAAETVPPPLPPEILQAISRCLEKISKYQSKLGVLMREQSNTLKHIDEVLAVK